MGSQELGESAIEEMPSGILDGAPRLEMNPSHRGNPNTDPHRLVRAKPAFLIGELLVKKGVKKFQHPRPLGLGLIFMRAWDRGFC